MTMSNEEAGSQPPAPSNGPSAASTNPRNRAAPFTFDVFKQSADVKIPGDFQSLMPATHRTKNDHIMAATASLEFLQQELLIDSIMSIRRWLWACGRPMPPRPLHYQVMLSREIIISENPHMHLVWGDKRMFLKPLPGYLLDKAFWETHILRQEESESEFHKVEECARGFLFSYCALIAFESDFRIAKEKYLIPDALTWDKWQKVSAQILQSHSYSTVSQRYWYGELRLGRLNTIYRIAKPSPLRGFSRANGYAAYGDLIRDNMATLASILGYVVIVLTALQVGLATERLTNNEAFQRASYGFTVFSILAPLGAIAIILAFTCVWIVVNYRSTIHYEKRRFQEMGVEVLWEENPDEKKSLIHSRENPLGKA